MLTASSDVEFEYTVRFVAADLSNGDSIDFRVATLDAYTVTANATITKTLSYTMPAVSGSYSVSGTDANLEYHRSFAAASGSYSVTGTDAVLSFGYTMAADSGSYSITGTDVNFLRGYNLAADSGAYTVSGTDANPEYHRIFAADSGSYAITGTDAGVLKGYLLGVDSGSYAINGTPVTLTYSGGGGGDPTTWTDRTTGLRMGTRSIVYPGYHGRGRKY